MSDSTLIFRIDRRKVWKLRCPAKARLLMWTNLENKTPTWDNLQKWNYYVRGWCILCKADSKLINHLFISCVFSRTIWSELVGMYNKPLNWHGDSVDQVLHTWASDWNLTSYKALPTMICWGI